MNDVKAAQLMVAWELVKHSTRQQDKALEDYLELLNLAYQAVGDIINPPKGPPKVAKSRQG